MLTICREYTRVLNDVYRSVGDNKVEGAREEGAGLEGVELAKNRDSYGSCIVIKKTPQPGGWLRGNGFLWVF